MSEPLTFVSENIVVGSLTRLLNTAARFHANNSSIKYLNYFYFINSNRQMTVLFTNNEEAAEHLKNNILLIEGAENETLVTIGFLRVDFNQAAHLFQTESEYVPMVYFQVPPQVASKMLSTIQFSELGNCDFEWTAEQFENRKKQLFHF